MSERDQFRAWQSITTRWDDNDQYGHVNNAKFYEFIDSAVNSHLIHMGALDPAESPIIGLVVESGCRYHAPIRYPEPVEVGIAVEKIGTSSVTYRAGVFVKGHAKAAATGHFAHVYVDRVTRRPTPLPDRLRDVVSALT